MIPEGTRRQGVAHRPVKESDPDVQDGTFSTRPS